MSGAGMFDRQMLEVAFSEIDAVHRALPQAALTALAQEVVKRVARSLSDAPQFLGVPSAREIDDLCDALLSNDPRAAAEFIETVQGNDISYDVICLSYLGVAARRLGELWDEDRVPFYRVTVAAGRIYAILRVLRLERRLPTPDLRRAAIFASVPGENHTLGITIAADLARDQGWDIELFVGLSHEDLLKTLEQRQPALIGLSASGKRSLPSLTRLIVALRISVPNARILVCGQIAVPTPDLVGLTRADATAQDFQSAIDHMDRLIGSRSARLS